MLLWPDPMAPVDMKFLSGKISSCSLGSAQLHRLSMNHLPQRQQTTVTWRMHWSGTGRRFSTRWRFSRFRIKDSLSGSRDACPHCLQPWYSVIQNGPTLLKLGEIYIVGYKSCSLPQPLHYWLRPIKGGQFRLVNFASHFIRVQIFQIYFPLIFYL